MIILNGKGVCLFVHQKVMHIYEEFNNVNMFRIACVFVCVCVCVCVTACVLVVVHRGVCGCVHERMCMCV